MKSNNVTAVVSFQFCKQELDTACDKGSYKDGEEMVSALKQL